MKIKAMRTALFEGEYGTNICDADVAEKFSDRIKVSDDVTVKFNLISATARSEMVVAKLRKDQEVLASNYHTEKTLLERRIQEELALPHLAEEV